MKKLLALLLAVVMSVAVLAGCGNPVYEDFENFLNVEMVEVNANYEKLKTEVGTWEGLADDAALAASLKDVLIPLTEDSLAKLEAINPETEEVQAIKAKYVAMMETYKEGFEGLLEGCETQDEELAAVAYEKLGEAVEILNDYNADLEAMASENGGEIEY